MAELARRGLNAVDQGHLQRLLLARHGNFPFRLWPPQDVQKLRQTGFMERTVGGRSYVRGRSMSEETVELLISGMARHGCDVRRPFYEWATAEKNLCPQWRAVKKYVDRGYGTDQRGRVERLSSDDRHWLRMFAISNPKMKLKDIRSHLWQQRRKIMSVPRIGAILHETGLSRQNVAYLASQKFSPSNIQYSRDFLAHIYAQGFQRPAFFDESGINQNGMSNRRNDGWNIVGSGGAFLTRPLRDWPQKNLTVMGMHDRSGVFCVDVHEGGTDQAYVDNYMRLAADTLAARGCDCLILDNCPAHKLGMIQYFMNRQNIAVVFLPRYCPEFNPIEICWNWMKDFLGDRMTQLRNDPVPQILAALNSVTGALARSFIRKSGVYPLAWYADNWNGPGPF